MDPRVIKDALYKMLLMATVRVGMLPAPDTGLVITVGFIVIAAVLSNWPSMYFLLYNFCVAAYCDDASKRSGQSVPGINNFGILSVGIIHQPIIGQHLSNACAISEVFFIHSIL